MRRRTAVIVALFALSLTLAGSPPAQAHFCSTPLQVPVDRPVTFTVGVPAEDSQVGKVVIEVPKGFKLHRAIELPGWELRTEGNVVTYTGGPIFLFQCGFFTLAGEVPEKATLVVPFTTYSPEGELVQEFRSRILNEVDAAQLVYAGTTPAARDEDPHARGNPAMAAAGWALMGVAALGGAALLIRRRRAGGGASGHP